MVWRKPPSARVRLWQLTGIPRCSSAIWKASRVLPWRSVCATHATSHGCAYEAESRWTYLVKLIIIQKVWSMAVDKSTSVAATVGDSSCV